MHFDKYTVRRALVSFRDLLSDFRTIKNEKLIMYIQSIHISADGEYEFPEADEMAKGTALEPAKVKEIIRNLYKSLRKNLSDITQPIKKLTFYIWIRIPSEELDERAEKRAHNMR